MSSFKRRNWLLVLILVLALILLATVLVRLRSVSQVADLVEALPPDLELALQDVNYTHTESGLARWRLKAERAERQVTDQLLAVKNPEVTFYDETGAMQMVLTAERGEADQGFTELTARGQVVIRSARGYQLFADELVYTQQNQMIRSDSPVVLSMDEMLIKGRGLLLDIQQRRMTILQNVDAVLPGIRPARIEP